LKQVSDLKNAIPNFQDNLGNPDALKNFKFSEEQLRDTLKKSMSSSIPRDISKKNGNINTQQNKKEPSTKNQSGGNSNNQLYNYIINPHTNRKVSIYSKKGLDILEKYAVHL
jgi:hypothetical protein